MKIIRRSSKFKKDVKRFLSNERKMNALLEVVRMLENELPLPLSLKPHMLESKWKGYMECHVENDFLLIWIDETTDTIKLVRLGSHSDLFK